MQDRAVSLVREAASIGVLGIGLSGGDVLLYPYLSDVIAEMAKHRFLPTSLATKSYLTIERAKEIADAPSVIWSVQFSIDSTVSTVADFLVRQEGFRDRILASIDNALSAGVRVTVKAVITPYNILSIPKLYRDLRGRGVSVVRLATYCRSGFHHTDDLFNHAEGYAWLDQELQKLRDEFPDDKVFYQNGSPNPPSPSAESRHSAWKVVVSVRRAVPI